MKYILNIGNTNTTAFQYTHTFTPFFKVHTEDLDWSRFSLNDQLAVATVVPQIMRGSEHLNIFNVSPATCQGLLDLSQVDASTIGADRIANAVALVKHYQLPAISIDFGTAITVECVDINRAFVGGAILPGRKISREMMNAYTAQLPLLEMGTQRQTQLGKTTLTSLAVGIDGGVIGAVKEMISIAMTSLGKREITIVFTGGDAMFFKSVFPEMILDEFLTIKGIVSIWEGPKNES